MIMVDGHVSLLIFGLVRVPFRVVELMQVFG
jgi:hypothetical protein